MEIKNELFRKDKIKKYYNFMDVTIFSMVKR